MFHHGNILARAPFGAADVLADGHFNTVTFRHGDFLAQGLFGTRTFRHRNISARGHFGTWTFRHSSTGAEMSVPKRPYCFARCQNIHVLKCSDAKISLCRNVQVPKIPRDENSPCRKFPMSKCSGVENPSAGTSAVPNGACAEMFP